jgi:3-isopropylmalate/(R)-2-methylmalate dehydratase small subunit
VIAGTAVLLPGDDVDTDVLYPGPFLNIQDPERMRRHLFEGIDPSLRDRLSGDTVLVVGGNFGCGSSREHVVQAMRASGIRCVLGHSFARIFYRNCINLGLLAIAVPDAAAAAADGDEVAVDVEHGTVTVAGAAFPVRLPAAAVLAIVEAGGLVPFARARASAAP